MQYEFSSLDQLSLHVCSWNTGGAKSFGELNLKDWLLPNVDQTGEAPDLIVVGFQSIVSLKSRSFFKNNKDEVVASKNMVMRTLNKYQSQAEYRAVREDSMFGLYIIVLAKKCV